MSTCDLQISHQTAASHHRSAASSRWVAAIVASACAGVLGLAAWLVPSSEGLGTHESLGLPPCGWIAIADFPCPTCGMTTAFAHAANGNLIASFLAQPFGCVLAIATGMTLLVSLHMAIFGSRLASALGRLWGIRTGWLVSALFVAGWAFKIISYKGWI